jgi:hypothetical protein
MGIEGWGCIVEGKLFEWQAPGVKTSSESPMPFDTPIEVGKTLGCARAPLAPLYEYPFNCACGTYGVMAGDPF